MPMAVLYRPEKSICSTVQCGVEMTGIEVIALDYLFTRGVVRTGQLSAATTYSHLVRPWTPISPSLTWDLSSGERWSAPLRRKIGRWRSSCRGIFLAHFARVQLARGYQPARATVAASALLHREHIDNYVYIELICNRPPHATRDLH